MSEPTVTWDELIDPARPLGARRNQRFFSIADFKTLVLRMLNASNSHDGIALQKLEAEIIDVYKETTMTHYQYTTLSNMCSILLEDWCTNWK